jgi:uncharacterized Zn finger protein
MDSGGCYLCTMAFSLGAFEFHLHRTILKRGKAYFDDGAVIDLAESKNNSFEAKVEGTETYDVWVSMSIAGDIVEDYACDCPFEGPVCKHVVAVLYAIRTEYGDKPSFSLKEALQTSEKHKDERPKKKTAAEQVDEILAILRPDQIHAFLREQCVEEDVIRRRFFLHFERLLHPVGRKQFDAQLKAILCDGAYVRCPPICGR